MGTRPQEAEIVLIKGKRYENIFDKHNIDNSGVPYSVQGRDLGDRSCREVSRIFGNRRRVYPYTFCLLGGMGNLQSHIENCLDDRRREIAPAQEALPAHKKISGALITHLTSPFD